MEMHILNSIVVIGSKKGIFMKLYEDCIVKLEYRSSSSPTKKYIGEVLKALKDNHIDAWWSSVVDPVGMPLFPSKIYPAHYPEASKEAFSYLVNGAHDMGIVVMSWYPLNMSKCITDAHPSWRMKFLNYPKINIDKEKAKNYVCFNSPYRDILLEFLKEVIEEFNFDGFIFDGASWSMPPYGNMKGFVPGCCCNFCKERFLKEKGLDIPTKIDWESETFRIWIKWRYEIFMQLWKDIVEAVNSVNPQATVCFNTSNRRYQGNWFSAIPLRCLNLDAVIKAEFNCFYGQADFQMKMLRAMGGKKGFESWLAMCDSSIAWHPGLTIDTLIQAGLGCLSAGGAMSNGSGAPISFAASALGKVRKVLLPRVKYKKGKPIEYAANWISQQTMDYFGHEDVTRQWDFVQGVNELMLQCHLPCEVVFDDHIAKGDFSQYKIVIAGNAVCISKKQAENLEKYVREGGLLILCNKAGTMNEEGIPYRTPILDNLMGIKSRREGKSEHHEILYPTEEKLLKISGGSIGIIPSFEYQDLTIPEAVSRAEIIAKIFEQGKEGIWKERKPDGDGAWFIKVDKGKILYFCADVFEAYLKFPTPGFRRFLEALFCRYTKPSLKLDGPIAVTMNAMWLEEGKVLVHLHNYPGPGYRYPLKYHATVSDIPPVGEMTLQVNIGRVKSAESAISKRKLEVKNYHKIIIPQLNRHDILILDVK